MEYEWCGPKLDYDAQSVALEIFSTKGIERK